MTDEQEIQLTMLRTSTEYAVKEVDDFLRAIRNSEVVSQSRVVDTLLDIRNLIS